MATYQRVTESDYREFTTGLLPARRARRTLSRACPPMRFGNPSRSAMTMTTDLPDSSAFDGRTVVLPVRNQLGCGGCWAFTTISTVEYAVASRTGRVYDLSEQALVSCNDEGFSCAAGGWWAFDSLQRHGLVEEQCCPYLAHKGVIS